MQQPTQVARDTESISVAAAAVVLILLLLPPFSFQKGQSSCKRSFAAA